MTLKARPVAPDAPAHRCAFTGLPTLMGLALAGADLTGRAQALLARAQADPGDANALLDLSIVLQLTGHPDVALAMQGEALKTRRVYHLPCAVDADALRVLAVMAPGELMANTPVEFLAEGTGVSLDLLYIDDDAPLPAVLPPHDLLFVAVGESDRNRPLLSTLARSLGDFPRPVLNRPERIARLSRDGACTLLDGVPDLDMPASVRITRDSLTAIGNGTLAVSGLIGDGDFPAIVRPVGSHAGRALVKLDGPADVAPYLETLPDQQFYVARYVDYRGHDGLFRKYRIVFIDGRPFVAHMAISQHWMVHYLNAGMGDNEARREEEARFMASFEQDFARRHAAVLDTIVERVGLDYFGIDCAETRDGRLLIFEVDSALVVHAMDPADVYPYKQQQMRKVFDAFANMLQRRLKHGPA